MKIAIVGAGVSGLGAAYALERRADITVFESEDRLGGHANTVDIPTGSGRTGVDTGFIVFNTSNYPNFCGLLDALGVDSVPTDMSFAFAGDGLEWSSNFPRGVFAQRRNLVNPAFLGMLLEITRFNRKGQRDLAAGALEGVTLEGYLERRRFSEAFKRRYLLPMGAAIWSTCELGIRAVPAESFLRFFSNHRLLQIVQPTWRTVSGGSRTYVERIRTRLGARAHPGRAAVAVARTDHGGVEIQDALGQRERFDHVILACHADESLRLLTDADREERATLGAFRFSKNIAYLHSDAGLMPRRRAAWGSWNYMSAPGGAGFVTYWMNALQGLAGAQDVFVTLNPDTPPSPDRAFGAFAYDHPQFDAPALAAQTALPAIQGRRGVWHAGAWMGYGFHEDGLTAGLRVARALGGDTDWRFVDHRIPGPAPAREAARERAVA